LELKLNQQKYLDDLADVEMNKNDDEEEKEEAKEQLIDDDLSRSHSLPVSIPPFIHGSLP